METLPLLVLENLFKMMANRNEMIKCSQVCRNWRAAYQAIPKPDRLYLHFDQFLPLHRWLFYTNETVTEFYFLKIRNDLQFLRSSTARLQFANNNKLVIFPAYIDHPYPPVYEFSFREQLNHFKSLEHLEIHRRYPKLEPGNFWLEDAEIDLPKHRRYSLPWLV